MRAGPHRRITRILMMRRSVRVGVRRGLWCGRLERSTMPAAPCCRYGLPSESLSCPPQGPALLDDATSKQQAASWGEQSISVGHEGLRVEERFLDSSTPHSEVFLVSLDAVTNVRGQYS